MSNVIEIFYSRIYPLADCKIPKHWESRLTLRLLFEKYLDIFSTPRRSFFEFLSYFTTNEDQTEKLREFCSAEGQVNNCMFHAGRAFEI